MDEHEPSVDMALQILDGGTVLSCERFIPKQVDNKKKKKLKWVEERILRVCMLMQKCQFSHCYMFSPTEMRRCIRLGGDRNLPARVRVQQHLCVYLPRPLDPNKHR
ncbi:uncharacterized protein [Euphorbia lathyris]|uniref:uncharacterized protein isoform X2 n=1 Tax=Euphorbia lathyris TaxID=212925 RepID=UPI00331377F3